MVNTTKDGFNIIKIFFEFDNSGQNIVINNVAVGMLEEMSKGIKKIDEKAKKRCDQFCYLLNYHSCCCSKNSFWEFLCF